MHWYTVLGPNCNFSPLKSVLCNIQGQVPDIECSKKRYFVTMINNGKNSFFNFKVCLL